MAAKPSKRFYYPRHWTLAQRLDHHTDKSGGPDACWPWVGGTITSNGYGRLKWEGRNWLAHRLAWIEKHGPIPPATPHVLHRCDNPPCRNEDHLWLGADADNVADRDAKGRQVSPKGEANGSAKLTEDDVRAIRAAVGTQRAIAKRFGVSKTNVGKIRRGEAWPYSA